MKYTVKASVVEIADTPRKDGTPMKTLFCSELDDEEKYPTTFAFELKDTQFTKLSGINTGDIVEVTFYVSSRKWNDKFFTSLRFWDIKKLNPSVLTPVDTMPF